MNRLIVPRKGQGGPIRASLPEHLVSVVRKAGLVFPIPADWIARKALGVERHGVLESRAEFYGRE